MNTDDELPDTDEELTPEIAFRRSEGHEYRGRTLEPFTYWRKVAAMAMGLQYWKLTPDQVDTLINPGVAAREKLEEELGGLTIKKQTPKILKRIEAIEAKIAELADIPEEIEVYNGQAQDTAIILWLCSIPETKVRKVQRKPQSFDAELGKWADENGIFQAGTVLPSGEAFACFLRIVNDVNISKGQPVIPDSHKGESDPNI